MKFRVAHFNGIDGRAGTYASPWSSVDSRMVREFLRRATQKRVCQDSRRLQFGTSPSDLSDCGWGIVYSQDLDPSILEALDPLISHRRAQVGPLFKTFLVARAESAETFLATHGSGLGSVHQPSLLPYYLLLIGSPSDLPFSFQVELQRSHAVGRIQFDSPEDYANYARTVVSVETEGVSRSPSVCIVETSHPGDPAAAVMAENFGRPVSQDTRELFSRYGYSWNLLEVSGRQATKRTLTRLLEAEDSPTLLIFTGHTVIFPSDGPYRFKDQGAWLCSDWPHSPADSEAIEREWMFGASDVRERATLKGMIGFSPSSFAVGRASRDSFELPWELPSPVGSQVPYVAPLPTRLLCHPIGGAIAFVGQIDRSVVIASGDQSQSACLREWVRELIAGLPVGEVLKRFQHMACELAIEAERGVLSASTSQEELDWIRLSRIIAAENAQTYTVLGDPAARIPRFTIPPTGPLGELG